MELDADKILERAITDAFREGIKSKLTGYNSDLDKVVSAAITTHAAGFRKLMETAIGTCLNESDFIVQIQTAVRQKLASTLIQRFGGEMEKQVNLLKSDPTTRARITLAIEEIVAQKA